MHKTILYIIAVLIATSCNQSSESNIDLTSTPIDSLSASCPVATTDDHGNFVLSWVRRNQDSTLNLCYAVSNGDVFDKTIVIPGTQKIHPHNENLPKLIFKPSGEIIAIWGASNPNPKNKYSGLVYYAQSFDDGKTWTSPKSLVKDIASFDQRYFDVALLPDGEAGVVWLDNRKTINGEGSGLYFARSVGRSGFQDEKLIAQPTCQCCRTDLFIDENKNFHVLYRGIINDSIRDMQHIVSTDNGSNFSAPKLISDDNWVIYGCPHTGPSMTSSNNNLHFAWYTGGIQRGSFYNTSRDNGNTFSARQHISAQGMHPQMTTLANGNVAIVWDEPAVHSQPQELSHTTVHNAAHATATSYNKKIGFQIRSAQGQLIENKYLTGEGIDASYPVITSSNGKTMVAFIVKENNSSYVHTMMIR